MKAQFINENIVSFKKSETEKSFKESLFPLNRDKIVEYVEKLIKNYPLDFSNLSEWGSGMISWGYVTEIAPPSTYFCVTPYEKKDDDRLWINFMIKENGTNFEFEWIFPNREHTMQGAIYRKKRVNSIKELDTAIRSIPEYTRSNELWEIV